MALLDKFNQNISTLSGPKTPKTPIGATDQSKLHDEYSINGGPKQNGKPAPSTLGLGGQTPKNAYKNRAPEGSSF